MEQDISDRFGVRFKQDVSPFQSPTKHAMLIEKYNFSQVEIDSSKKLEESHQLYTNLLEARQKEKELLITTDHNNKTYRNAKQTRKKIQRQIHRKRTKWLDDIQGHPSQVSRLVRKHLLDFEPVSYSRNSTCVICFDCLEEGSFGFVCDRDHAMHFYCAVELITNALLDCRSPLDSLCCPYRCGCYFVFRGKKEPSRELRRFKRVFITRASLKRKECETPSRSKRPLKRQSPFSTFSSQCQPETEQ